MRSAAFVVTALLGLAACEPAGSGDLVDIDANGTVLGSVFVDANVSGMPDLSDPPAAQVDVALVLAASGDTVARTRTDATGAFVFPLVPVGRYSVVVPASALGDTMGVVFRDPPGLPVGQIEDDDETTFVVGDADSVDVLIGVAYPVVTVESARQLPVGRHVFVRAVAIAGVGSAADSTLFIDGETRGLAVRRSPNISAIAGDSVLVFGETATRDGQPVLINGSATVLDFDASFDTIQLSAATARTAGGGIHDARLVRVNELIVTDTARAAGRFVMTAENPGGTIDVSIPVGGIQAEYVPGFEFDVVGVLVPQPGLPGTWQVRPRSPADVLERDP